MIERIVKLLAREIRGLHQTAYLLALFALLSSFLALVRDRILAGEFGAGEILDIYYTAFRIPDILFFTIALMVSVFVLIPLLNSYKDQNKSKELIGSIIMAFALILIGIDLVLFPFIPVILNKFFPALMNGEYGYELVWMSRIMLLQPLFLGISNILSAVTQTAGRYILYATAPLLYNIGIISGVLLFYPIFGIYGLALGVIMGALAHMSIQIPFLRANGFLTLDTFKIRIGETLKIIKISLPRTLGMSASHIAFFFLYSVASGITTGAVSVIQLANNLQAAPVNIIGSSYSVAAFPTLSRLFAQQKMDKFKEHISLAIRHIIFWSMPLIAVVVVLRAHIVRLVLGSGAFDWTDTRLTAAVLAIFIITLTFQSISLLLVRAFYAIGNTFIPFIINVSIAIFMIIFAYVFLHYINHHIFLQTVLAYILRINNVDGANILVIPLAFASASIINAFLLTVVFSLKFGKIKVGRVLSDSIVSAFAFALTIYFSLHILDNYVSINTTFGLLIQASISLIVGALVWSFVLVLFKSKEFVEIISTLSSKFWKRKAISDIDNTTI